MGCTFSQEKPNYNIIVVTHTSNLLMSLDIRKQTYCDKMISLGKKLIYFEITRERRKRIQL